MSKNEEIHEKATSSRLSRIGPRMREDGSDENMWTFFDSHPVIKKMPRNNTPRVHPSLPWKRKTILVNDDTIIVNSYVDCDIIVTIPRAGKPLKATMSGRFRRSMTCVVPGKVIDIATRDDIIIARALLEDKTFTEGMPQCIIMALEVTVNVAAKYLMEMTTANLEVITNSIIDSDFGNGDVDLLNAVLYHFGHEMIDEGQRCGDVTWVVTRLYDAIIAGQCSWAILVPVTDRSSYLYLAIVKDLNPMRLDDYDSGDELIM